MKYLCLLMISMSVSISHAQDKTMCITVDDLPVVSYGADGPDFHLQITQELINTFNAYTIPAIGYVNEFKLYEKYELPYQ